MTPISPSHKHKHPLAMAFPLPSAPFQLLEKSKLSFSRCQTSSRKLGGNLESGILVSLLLVPPEWGRNLMEKAFLEEQSGQMSVVADTDAEQV